MLTHTKLVFGLVLAASLSAGCARTTYKSQLFDKDGKVIANKELDTRTIGITRTLGQVKLGEDSLGGSQSDQMEAVSKAADALKAAVDKIK